MIPWIVALQAPLSMGFSPGKNIGVGCHSLLQGIFLTQGFNLCLLHFRADSLPSGPPGNSVWGSPSLRSLLKSMYILVVSIQGEISSFRREPSQTVGQLVYQKEPEKETKQFLISEDTSKISISLYNLYKFLYNFIKFL